MTADKQLRDLNTYVGRYYCSDLKNGDGLSVLLQKITGLLYYLETVRSEIHNQYETTVFELVKDGQSVSRATNQANVQYPEMYQFRRIMDAGYRIIDAIRTNISYLKSQRANSN